MKRMFVILVASLLAACAAQPERVATQNDLQAVDAQAEATVANPPRASQRVYLDDYDLLHMKSAPAKRRAMVLGSGNR